MNEIINLILTSPYGVLWMILASIATIAIVCAAVVGIVYLRKLLKKMNVDIDDEIIATAKTLIKEIVLYFNQKIVDDLKSKSDDGKLTDEDKANIYNSVLAKVKEVLSNDMLNAILKKYGGDDVDFGLEILIEAAVSEAKVAALTRSKY